MPNFLNDGSQVKIVVSTANKNIHEEKYEFKSNIMAEIR